MTNIYIDAAHCHSPVGGQGMNLGLQDGMYVQAFYVIV
jgi:2-polyprenyl-6-methoxyphenol hydroxylase-like FAD-dependent oxidoreductase